MTVTAQLMAAWVVAAGASLLAVLLALHEGRRRSAINEAIHELRRPLHAIALASGRGPRPAAARESSVRLAASALERLDREVNGGDRGRLLAAVECGTLTRSAVNRWRRRAIESGGDVELRWEAGVARVTGDRVDLAQALDNLVVNAIEHGGGRVLVAGRRAGSRLRVEVSDEGREDSRRRPPEPALAVFVAGRRGHGLRVVRRVAAEHGGRFVLSHGAGGATAILELPLAPSRLDGVG